MAQTFARLEEHIIRRGLCTACGSCAGVCPAGAVGWVYEDDEPLPVLTGECRACGVCATVCPGGEVDMPTLERFIFGREREEKVPDLGFYLDARAARAVDRGIRAGGAGGGLVTALLVYALEKGLIDCALVAGFAPDRPWRTAPRLAATRGELLAAAGSKYACVPVNALLNQARDRGYRRLAVVGLPCQIHALRKMQHAGQPAHLVQSLVLLVGLFCASQFYFEGTRHLLVERLGVEPEEVLALHYRGGQWPGHLVVELKDGRRLTLDRHQYMYHHLMPAFKRDRCEMCVDWSSELADLSVGDYWASGGAVGGTSACLVRTRAGAEMLAGAVKEGYVETDLLEASRLAAGIGFELKKHAAAYRLRQRRRFGWPVPDYHRETDCTPFARELHLAPES